MNIYYDNIVFWLQRSGGISRYWQELAVRFIADADSEITFVEQQRPCENRFREALNMTSVVYEKRLPLQIVRYLNVRAKLKEGSVFHSSYYRDINAPRSAKIVTVHDMTYELYVKGLKKTVHTAQKRHAVRAADGVICISENTRRDLLKFFPEIDESKITVVHNGVGEDFRPSDKPRGAILETFGLKDDKYAVFLGDRGRYKNFDAAVKACALSGHFLLVMGGKPVTDEEKQNLNNSLHDRYKIFGYMTNEQICEVFSAADCLLYTSLYEGFGLPVLEAMRCGCPVVASHCSSLPEAAGDAGILVKNMTPEGYAEAMDSLKDRRNELIARGFAHSANFSWDRCFEETKSFYAKVLGKMV